MLYRLSYGLEGRANLRAGSAAGQIRALIRAAQIGVSMTGNRRTFAMALEFRADAETAESLRARAERLRALSRVAVLPFTHAMLQGLAQQLEGEAKRAETASPDPASR